jgi:hypothetical protein
MQTLFGTIFGIVVGLVIGAMLAAAAPLASIPLIGPLLTILVPFASGTSVNTILMLAFLLSLFFYLFGYFWATSALLRPPGIGGGANPDVLSELGARAFTCSLTGTLNLVLLFITLPLCALNASPGLFCTAVSVFFLAIPPWFWPLMPFAVAIIQIMAGNPFFSRNPIFQVFVGWIGWLSPLSYIATGVGFILFVINLPFSLIQFGPPAIRIDFGTGTVESTGGLVALASRRFGYPGAATRIGGFSLGKFNFLIHATAGVSLNLASQGAFTGASVSSHEVGHSLNTSAMGGVILWINAIDENTAVFAPTPPGALAYGELLAESHSSQAGRSWVRIWS